MTSTRSTDVSPLKLAPTETQDGSDLVENFCAYQHVHPPLSTAVTEEGSQRTQEELTETVSLLSDTVQTAELAEDDGVHTGNATGLYLWILLSIVAGAVVVSNLITQEECAGVKEKDISWFIWAPTILLCVILLCLGLLSCVRWVRKRTDTATESSTDNAVGHPGNLTTFMLMMVYFMFTLAAASSFLVDFVVVEICIESNGGFDIAESNISAGGILDAKAAQLMAGVTVPFLTYIFFCFGLALRRFYNNTWYHNCLLGLIILTHVLLWVKSFTAEISDMNDIFHWWEDCGNGNVSGMCKEERDTYSGWKPWLYPGVVEYCLFSISMSLILWQTGRQNQLEESCLDSAESLNVSNRRHLKSLSTNAIVLSFIISVPVLLAFCVPSALTIQWMKDSTSSYLHSAVFGTLSVGLLTKCLLITASVFVLLAIHGIRRKPVGLEAEDYLTVATGIGIPVLSVLIMVSDIMFLDPNTRGQQEYNNSLTYLEKTACLSFFESLADCLQGTLQTVVYIRLIRFPLGMVKRRQFLLLVGVCFSAGLNLVLFFWSVLFQGHLTKLINEVQTAMFGESTWHGIITPLYPLEVFYRFHCVLAFIRVIEPISRTGRQQELQNPTIYQFDGNTDRLGIQTLDFETTSETDTSEPVATDSYH